MPAVSWFGDFNAGYDRDLDASAVEIPLKEYNDYNQFLKEVLVIDKYF